MNLREFRVLVKEVSKTYEGFSVEPFLDVHNTLWISLSDNKKAHMSYGHTFCYETPFTDGEVKERVKYFIEDYIDRNKKRLTYKRG